MRTPVRKSILLSLPLLIGSLMAVWALSSCSSPSPAPSTAPMVPSAAAQAAASPPTGAAPPAVSYNVVGDKLTQDNARAASYCGRYEESSRLMLVQDGVATYTCSTSTTTVPPPPARLRLPATSSAPAG